MKSPTLLIIAATGCFAQGRVSEFLSVQSWQGTISITGSGSGTTSGGPYSDVWKYSIASSATVTLPTIDSNIEGWTGAFNGTSGISANNVDTLGGCNQTSTQTFQGAIGVGKTFTMHLMGTNQYVFYPSDYVAQGGTSTTVNSCAPGTIGGTGPVTWAPVLSTVAQTLPATGFSLKGSETLTMNSPLQPNSLLFGGTAAVINVTVTWDFEPGAVGGHPPFFSGENSLGSGVYYLQFQNNNVFGYYNYVAPSIFYHYDMGFEAFIAGSGADTYLYDFTTNHWLYTSTALFPYLYDFTLKAWIYYFPDTKNPGHYTASPRYFSNLATGTIFTM